MATPLSHKQSRSLPAATAGVSFSVPRMNIVEFIDNLKTIVFARGQLDPEQIDPDLLMRVSDVNTLKLISENAGLFKKLSLSEAWLVGDSRQRILGKMDILNRYIADLQTHTCTCIKYKYLTLDPQWELDEGLISIVEQFNSEDFDTYECQNCEKSFKVTYTINEIGHDEYLWNEN